MLQLEILVDNFLEKKKKFLPISSNRHLKIAQCMWHTWMPVLGSHRYHVLGWPSLTCRESWPSRFSRGGTLLWALSLLLEWRREEKTRDWLLDSSFLLQVQPTCLQDQNVKTSSWRKTDAADETQDQCVRRRTEEQAPRVTSFPEHPDNPEAASGARAVSHSSSQGYPFAFPWCRIVMFLI